MDAEFRQGECWGFEELGRAGVLFRDLPYLAIKQAIV